MYADFYKLQGRPFQLTPDPRFYFDSRTHRKAMAYLTYGLNQGEGFIIVTGDIGTGKTTLVGHLFENLDQRHYLAAKVVTTQLDADDTLRMVAGAFGIRIEGMDKASILQQMEQFLHGQARQRRRVLLIVDEAQNLPISALEELRMLSNFQENNRALLQIFLLGQPEFRDKLASSNELEQLRQRVIATHHLEPMDVEEISDYVYHRLKLVGWNKDPIFTDGAFRQIHDFSGGVPRRLNNLMSRLLLFGAIEELHEIDEAVVAEVIADLKKDHTPTTGPKHVLDSGVALSGTGPLRASRPKPNVPPKIARDRATAKAAEDSNGHAHQAGDISQLEARLARLEDSLARQEQTLRETLDILGEWMDLQSGTHGR
ncbi:MAG: XrtA-associated ATPase [Sphingomonadales bacterium]